MRVTCEGDGRVMALNAHQNVDNVACGLGGRERWEKRLVEKDRAKMEWRQQRSAKNDRV